jgi:glutamyl-Q tRNA(Asp) synthetase
VITRFAPSTTGEAHPGTLLSALLVWLSARAVDGRAILRLEDLDTTRVKAAWSEQMVEALEWLGLAWDETGTQSARTPRHEAALDQLATQGRLYPCTCSRGARRGHDRGRVAPDGGWAYENTCRARSLPMGGWRAVTGAAVRVRLPDERVELVDEGGLVLSQTPAFELGDPIVRRRDRAIAYQLAVVVDDAEQGITDVIRGRDIAASTATQVMLQRLLGFAQPRYRHHFLLLEAAGGGKLAKLHGSIPWTELRARYSDPRELCSVLAVAAGLGAGTPPELVAGFSWSRVPSADKVAQWRASSLVIS